jgi:hypothetical protein
VGWVDSARIESVMRFRLIVAWTLRVYEYTA